jgi:hypothetical protein
MIIIVFIICICIMCISSSLIAIYFYKRNFTTWDWKVINKSDNKYIIGRINKDDSECMTNKGGIGCYIFIAKEDNELDDIIKDYPIVKINNKNEILDIYTCGKNSVNEELWGVTGYENENTECSFIKKKYNRDVFNF